MMLPAQEVLRKYLFGKHEYCLPQRAVVEPPDGKSLKALCMWQESCKCIRVMNSLFISICPKWLPPVALRGGMQSGALKFPGAGVADGAAPPQPWDLRSVRFHLRACFPIRDDNAPIS